MQTDELEICMCVRVCVCAGVCVRGSVCGCVCVANKHILLPFQAVGRHKYLQSAFKPRHTIKINKKPREERMNWANKIRFSLASLPLPSLPFLGAYKGNFGAWPE